MNEPSAAAVPSRSLRRRRIGREWAALVTLLAAFVAAAVHGDWFARADGMFYDSALRLWQRPASSEIVVVAIDDESLTRLGRWPWPRAIHAALLPRLATARGVFVDALLAEAERGSDGDARLAAALREHGRVVLPLHSIPAGESAWLPVYPVAELAAAARALAHIHVDTDGDGLVRRLYLREGPPGHPWPHAALALLELAPKTAAPAGGDTGAVVPGPWLKTGEFPIAFAGGPGHFLRLSYAAVLRGDVAPEFFRDKFVLVGATAPGLGDHFATPANTGGRLMPGVEVNAHVLQELREGIALARAPALVIAALGIAAILVAMAVNALLSPRARLVATASLALLLLALSALLLRLGGTWVPPATAITAVVFAYPLWSWRRLEAAQVFLDGELARLRSALHRRGALPRTLVGDPLEQRIAAIEAADAAAAQPARPREAISFLSPTCARRRSRSSRWPTSTATRAAGRSTTPSGSASKPARAGRCRWPRTSSRSRAQSTSTPERWRR